METRTKYVGIGTSILTIIALLGWFSNSPYFEQELSGDVKCDGTFEDPCEWHYNVTLRELDAYYIQNRNHTNLVFFPDVKSAYNCKRDNRFSSVSRTDRSKYPCGIGWREFNWSEPLTDKYGYVNKFVKGVKQEFKIVVFKHNPSDKIKFGGEIFNNNFDPYFLPKGGEWEYIKSCIETKPAYSEKVDTYGTCYQNHSTSFVYYINGTKNSQETRFLNTTTPYLCVNGSEIKKYPAEQECTNIGIIFNGKKVLYEDNGFKSCFYEDGIVCEYQHQADGNNKCESGEACAIFSTEGTLEKSTVSRTSFTKEAKVIE